MPRRNWWRDKLRTDTYTEDGWNDMYKDAEKNKKTGDIGDFNDLYDTVKHKDDQDVKDWNDNAHK